jgi:hypothetical protein
MKIFCKGRKENEGLAVSFFLRRRKWRFATKARRQKGTRRFEV